MESYVYIETYGCSANKNNSEILAGLLKEAGYEITNNENIANILIINSCIVKGKTESKIIRRIQDLIKLYPKKIIIISGCMPETDIEQLKKLNKNLLFLGTHHIKDIVRLIRDYYESKFDSRFQDEILNYNKEEKLLLPKIPHNKLISITQISEGCLGECSYCKVRLAKGKLYSYTEEKILKSIESDLKAGAKEIWLTSHDCASYGLDKDDKKSKLPELLRKILDLNYKFKLRLGMMNPNNLYPILDEIIDIYKSPKIYKFLHIPVQSANNKILYDMNRPYKIKEVEFIINRFKKQFLNITIATDIIVGYPTEDIESHKSNLQFIADYCPDVFNLSKFSRHINTKASLLPTLDKALVNKRAAELMDLHRTTAKRNNMKFLNKKFSVFINSKSKIPGIFEARDENYNIVLISSKDKSILGKNLEVLITQVGVHHLIGKPLSN
jgi:threonylcarbamoyladenosine tRNA methylthiotransferase CDKAL1